MSVKVETAGKEIARLYYNGVLSDSSIIYSTYAAVYAVNMTKQ